jgi:hypothetical protein
MVTTKSKLQMDFNKEVTSASSGLATKKLKANVAVLPRKKYMSFRFENIMNTTYFKL